MYQKNNGCKKVNLLFYSRCFIFLQLSDYFIYLPLTSICESAAHESGKAACLKFVR